MANGQVSFLCGVIEKGSEGLLARGSIRLRNGEHLEVSPNDPGLAKIKPGRMRMIVVKDGRIIAVFASPRIKLLRMLERGATVTEDLLECYMPMYPKAEWIPRTTYRWMGTFEQRYAKDSRTRRP